MKVFVIYLDSQEFEVPDEMMAICADYESAIYWLIENAELTDEYDAWHRPADVNWIDFLLQEHNQTFGGLLWGCYIIEEEEIFSKKA